MPAAPSSRHDEEHPPSGGLPLAERVERRLDVLARRMVDTFVAEIPLYAWLPREQLYGEILEICKENLRIFFRCVREQRAPTEAEQSEPRASAARRAEERIPLIAVLTAYHIGGRIGWQAMVEEHGEDEHDELIAVADVVMTYIQTVTSSVASAYLEEQQHIYGEQRDARRTLAQLLLAGVEGDGQTAPRADVVAAAPSRRSEALEQAAARAGVELAPGYLVLALRLGTSPDERDAGVTGTVAGRRKVRRVQERLDELAGEPVLTLLDAEGGAVLFPAAPAAAEEAVGGVVDLVASLAAAAEAEVVAGASWRPSPEGAAAAAAEAREVLRLAQLLGRPPGAYRLDDVLLEHALTSPPGTAVRLARILEPLERRQDLLDTVEQWFACDFDRREAAAALSVHPNTLDYRLRRVAELTGLDLATSRGLQLLGAAVLARRLG